ncbi:MAG: nucleoside triphosphate pyrophosphohydrolase [Sporomusaceae bacterium]|nr:nucleoside triphosphate pyrophosphohydrolase [Sporomusaceae bacterium]
MGITIAGLGPGPLSLVSLDTWARIQAADALLLRTARHPAAEDLTAQGITFTAFDELYESLPTFDAVYQAIAEAVVERARQRQRLVFAVPGSPMVAERTVPLIKELAAAAGIAVTVLPAMSFLDLLYARLEIDPQIGLTIIDAAEIERLPKADAALIVTQMYDRQVASEAKLSLMELLPDDHEVVLCSRLGLAGESIRRLPLYELDRQADIDHLTSVYVPPYCRSRPFTLSPLLAVMRRLRSPGGCVWDIEQTHRSLRRYLVEEVYEVLEAIDEADADKLCEELGDLLLQIVFHARMAEESGVFSMQDVVNTVTEKMVRRHPHVFGEISVRDAAEVVVNWDKIKQQEKRGERTSVLDGVPQGLPGLMAAYKLQAKAAKVGFDWPEAAPVWKKLDEELAELREALAANDSEQSEAELGDVLFSVINLARKFNIDGEVALNRTNRKFSRRFRYLEERVKASGGAWQDYSLAELDKLWEEAKLKE